MKRIDEGIYTSAHNLIFVSKGYDYLSLFLKGNKTVLNGGNINKIHIFLDFTTCTFKLFDMLNEIAVKSKAMIIVHTCTETLCKCLNTFIATNTPKVYFRYDFHKNREQYELVDNSGKIVIYPYDIFTDNYGSRHVRKKISVNKKNSKRRK